MVSQNPIFLLVTGDFNARNSSWWKNNCVTREGNKIKSLTCSYGLSQLISDSTHIPQNSSSCINLIFTNQPNLVTDCGLHLSLHPNCHHQIVFSKLNLKIKYPPLYKRLVWDYKNADSQSINKAIEMFNWEKLFQNKNIHDQLKLLKKTIVNIVSNYIPNKFIIWNDKDPPLLNDHIKRLINLKNEIFKKYLKDGRPDSVYENLQTITWDLTEAVSSSKKFFYERLANKLNNPNTSAKAYWSIIKTLFNGKKVPVIPPPLVNNKLLKIRLIFLMISSVNNVNLYQIIAPSHQFRVLKLPID